MVIDIENNAIREAYTHKDTDSVNSPTKLNCNKCQKTTVVFNNVFFTEKKLKTEK